MKLLITTLYKKTLICYLFIKKNLIIIAFLTPILVFFSLTCIQAWYIWFPPLLENVMRADGIKRPIYHYIPMTLNQARSFLINYPDTLEHYIPSNNIFILWIQARYPDYIFYDSLQRPYYLMTLDLLKAFITQNRLTTDQAGLLMKEADPLFYGAIHNSKEVLDQVINCNNINFETLKNNANFVNNTIIGSIIIIAGLTIYVGIRYITG